MERYQDFLEERLTPDLNSWLFKQTALETEEAE
jgi:hypothetical protein